MQPASSLDARDVARAFLALHCPASMKAAKMNVPYFPHQDLAEYLEIRAHYIVILFPWSSTMVAEYVIMNTVA